MDRRTLASHLSQLALGVMCAACVSFVTQASGADSAHRDRQIRIEGIPQSVRTADASSVTEATEIERPVSSATRAAASQRPASKSQVRRGPSMVQQAAYGQVVEPAPRLVRGQSQVKQVSYGCSCGECVGEPTCGFEPMGEVGCGAEGCGSLGCAQCCEPGCGLEACYEASCGTEVLGAGGCDACGVASCDGGCSASCGDCYNFCLPIFRMNWCNYEFFGGVQGFTGPANYANTGAAAANNPATSRIGSSSFGFYEGFNSGHSLKNLFSWDLASQLGVRFTQSSLSGAEFTQDSRNQVFVTAGLFRRVDFGLQYGVVYDYLNDDWYYHLNLSQLRGELSWNDGCSHEFGYQFMAGLGGGTSGTTVTNAAGAIFNGSISMEPTDQHRFFVRKTIAGGGQYQAFLGGTNHSDFLLGFSVNSASYHGWGVYTGATYLVPNEKTGIPGGNENESWNLSMGVVLRPGGVQTCGRYCRPLLDVADNGTFMADRR